MPLNGNNYFDVLIPQYTTIPYAVAGFAYSATASTTGQAGVFGIRKDAHLQIQGVTRVDAAGKEQTDGMMVKLELDLWQTDAPSFANMYYLSKQLVQCAPKIAAGDIYNFTDNSSANPFGSATTASGSVLLGMEWNYVLSTKDITNKVTLSGKMHPVEYDWLLGNTTSTIANTAVAGTATVGLSGSSYSQAAYGIPGINSLTLSGTNIGLVSEDTKLSFKSIAPTKTTREQPLCKFIEVEIDGKALQGRYFDQQYFTGTRNSDFTVSVVCWNGITFNFVNSLSFVGSPDLSDSSATIPFKLKGKIAYDPNGVNTNIAFSGNTITFTRSVYQP